MAALPEPVSRALKTLLHGVLLGVGAALGFGLVYLLGRPNLEAQVQRQLADIRATYEPAVADIAIADVREQRLDTSLRFLGTATNHGKIAVDRLYIDVDFFAGDAFVNKCREGVDVALAPGHTRPFVVDCGPTFPHMPAYDRFELSPIGASAPR